MIWIKLSAVPETCSIRTIQYFKPIINISFFCFQDSIWNSSRILNVFLLRLMNINRAAVEYEKKTRASNLEHKQAMEKSMVSMAHTIEKLHAELANAEKRARAAAAAAHPSRHSYLFDLIEL